MFDLTSRQRSANQTYYEYQFLHSQNVSLKENNRATRIFSVIKGLSGQP